MSLAADLAKLSEPSKLGGIGGRPSIASERKAEITYVQNYGNYDQRRGDCNVSINPLTNGIDFGARGSEPLEGTNNGLAVIKQ